MGCRRSEMASLPLRDTERISALPRPRARDSGESPRTAKISIGAPFQRAP